MNLLCLILLVCAVALWFFFVEYDSIFGVYYPTSAIRRKFFLPVILVLILLAIYFSRLGGVAETVTRSLLITSVECKFTLVILLTSFITLLSLRFFSIKGSVCYALLGALMAYALSVQHDYTIQLNFVLSFIAAPAISFVLALVFRLLFKAVFSRVKLHMITLAYYMRSVVILSVLLMAVALGLNWGGFLLGLGGALEGENSYTALVVTLAAVTLGALAITAKSKNVSEEPSGIFADFSIYAVLSVGFAVASTLLLFSFESTASLLSLFPVPLSVSTLVMASVAGVELAQKSPLVSREEYVNTAIGFLVAPLGSFILTHVAITLIDADAQNQLDDFAVMAIATVVLMTLSFAGYVRIQRRNREATDKLVYTQQQQIYEHSRALNDMELKVVISENQALHNAVEMKRQEVMNVALSIVEQREYLESLNQIVVKLSKEDDDKEKERLLAELRSSLKQRLSYDRDVDSQYFYAQAESLHEDFNAKLSENFPDLTQQERRLATLLRLGFSSKYIATLMNITPKSVEISRYRLRQKLGLDKGANLVNFIKSI